MQNLLTIIKNLALNGKYIRKIQTVFKDLLISLSYNHAQFIDNSHGYSEYNDVNWNWLFFLQFADN
jgi:hypothetical protein